MHTYSKWCRLERSGIETSQEITAWNRHIQLPDSQSKGRLTIQHGTTLSLAHAVMQNGILISSSICTNNSTRVVPGSEAWTALVWNIFQGVLPNIGLLKSPLTCCYLRKGYIPGIYHDQQQWCAAIYMCWIAVQWLLLVCHAKIGPTQKWSSGPILAAKNGPPGPLLVAKKWSHLAKTGPSRTRFGNQNRSGGVAKSSSPGQFGLLQMIPLPYSDCLSTWSLSFVSVKIPYKLAEFRYSMLLLLGPLL